MFPFLDLPTDPLTIRLRAEVEGLDFIPGPKTIGSEKYEGIAWAFINGGWTGFEETFDRIVPRSRTDYMVVKRDLLLEPLFSLKAQQNMLRLLIAWMRAPSPAEREAVLRAELDRIEAEHRSRLRQQ